MQRELREVHHTKMDAKDVARFAGLKRDGGLLTAEMPGHVIAKLALDGPPALSGRVLR